MNDTTVLLPHMILLLNIEHPGYEESYSFGYECAVAELAEDENPYLPGTEEHNQWVDGWWAGFYGEAPLFTSEPHSTEASAPETKSAANESDYHSDFKNILITFFKITGALAATAFIGYQVMDLVA